MANFYIKARLKWQRAFDQLEYDEVGRLMCAVFEYALTGEVNTPLTGSERILLPIILADLDDDSDDQADLSVKRKEAAKKRWTKSEKSEAVPPMQNASASFASFASEEEMQNDMQNANGCSNSHSHSNSHSNSHSQRQSQDTRAREDDAAGFVSDESAIQTQGEHDQILQAAEDGGFPKNNATRARMLDLYARFGKERILYGIRECVKHGASNLAYLEKVCQGGPKKKPPASPPAKVVVAQQYEQRDYSQQEEDADDVLDALAARRR